MIQDVLEAEANAIRNIPATNPFVECVELFLEAKRNGGKLIISGVGKAGEVGKKIAVTFCSIGLPSVVLHPLEAQHGDLGLLSSNDVLLLISNSGKTREILELEVLAKRLVPTVKVVSLTGKDDSDLATRSDFVLWTGDPEEICPLGLTPTTSTTTMSVIGDVLSALIVHLSGYSAQDYALRHHSGYLGEKSRLSHSAQPSPEVEQRELRHVYETLHKENHDFQTNNWMLDELPYLQALNKITKIDSIVEIGCGNGRFAIEAAKHFKAVTAIDWAASPIIMNSELPANLEYIVADVFKSVIPEADAVVSADFFEHLSSDRVRPLVEKLSSAAPVQFHKIACYPDSRKLHLTLQSPEEWLAMFKEVDAAFSIRKIEYRRGRSDQPVVTIVR